MNLQEVHTLEQPVSTLEANPPNEPLTEDLGPSFELEVIYYIQELRTSNGWVEHHVRRPFRIRTMLGSMYHDCLPVIRISVAFDHVIAKDRFVELFTRQRAQWDKFRKQVETIEEGEWTVQQFVLPFPVKNRFFCETSRVLSEKQCVWVVSHSVELPAPTKLPQGYTYFSVVELVNSASKAVITATSQTDLQLPNNAKSEELLAKIGREWAVQCFEAFSAV